MLAVEDLPTNGVAAPPRANGELIFQAPWESRAFAMAIALADQEVFGWPEFQQQLIAAIAAWEAEGHPPADYQYYACWLSALEALVDRHELVPAADLEQRVTEYLDRPHGYDHTHGDDDAHDEAHDDDGGGHAHDDAHAHAHDDGHGHGHGH
jgi:nitrile hydratase accessory protein